MKKIITLIALIITISVSAQDTKVQKVKLDQTKGEFVQKNLKLTEGKYIFDIHNDNAGVDVGFVLVPAGKDATNPDNHIKEAYVKNVVSEGQTESSNTVTLTKGTYTYFCPLNKTPQYTLVVE